MERFVPNLSDTQPDPLLILPSAGDAPAQLFVLLHGEAADPGQMLELVAAIRQAFPWAVIVQPYGRSEERRVGEGCVSTCRSLCAPHHYKTKKRQEPPTRTA